MQRLFIGWKGVHKLVGWWLMGALKSALFPSISSKLWLKKHPEKRKATHRLETLQELCARVIEVTEESVFDET